MPRTAQKKIKFTKGMITGSMAERTDLPTYDSSAELIRNYVCTPYGGFRTRRGLRLLENLDLSEKIYFSTVDDKTSGTYTDYNFVSGSLSSLQDGSDIAIFDIGEGNVKSEANIYLSNIRLDFQKPSLTAEFEETGVQYQAKLTKVSIVNGGLGFDGTLSVTGDVLSGETVITPVLSDLGTIESVSFSSATYKYLPQSPQDVIVSANKPKCIIGFSTSADGKLWSSEIKYEVTDTAIPSIKLSSTNCRYLRIRYFGSGIKNKISFDNLYAKYEFYKLIPFIYNISQKNLVVLSEKKILIFENTSLVKTINIDPALIFKNLRAVKWSQNEDVIVFTEAGVKPRELRRTATDWEFKEFPLKNIPFHNFGQTNEKKITTGITPNYEEGAVTITADGDIFEEASVGQQIDGNGGRLKITEFVSKSKVLGYTIIPFLNKDKITNWTYLTGWERVWSDTRGWPISCLFYQQRLWFGGSAQRPSTVWASRTGIYNDFNNAGNYDNDGINQDLNTENQIVNLLSNRGLQIFTSGDEWTAPEGKLTPNEFSVVKNTSNGSDIGLTPKNLGGVTLFIEKNGKSLLSYVYDYNQSAYTTSNIGILGNLISEPVDMDIDDNSSLDEGDYLYIVLKSGDMIITSLNFEQEINASSIFSTVGSILSVCNLINETYLLVNVGDKTYLEIIDDSMRTDLTIEKYVEKVITGLENYNGEYVHVYSGDEDFGKYLVKNGTVELRYAVNTNCNIGFAFSSELNSNDIAINGRSTSTFKRISKAVITTKDTNKIKLNGVEKYSNDNIFDFFAVSSYGKRVKFKIESEFDKIEVLSVLLYINYGAR
uniref:Stabilization protein n=1 Tax=Siphoviridae sp. ct7Qv4 TaxID=2827786 RepID=A0A8S5SMX4_9CAUD|nr:MAG TPA: stabilization protein [Siphoviridae sp. ct7Qv4]